MNIRTFGKMPNGQDVYGFTISDGTAQAEIITYGASIASFKPFGTVDVLGGFDSLESYLEDTSFQGAIVGRVANRIEGACIEIDGKTYTLPDNDNGNCNHSGGGFSLKVWNVENFNKNSITLSYYSPDGEGGFPGALTVHVTYTVIDSAIHIEYKGFPDGVTPIALTNHAFFNLDGFGGDVLNHKIKIFAERYTEVNEKLIPNGNHPLVESTKMDFREFRLIDDGSGEFCGYDQNFVVSPSVYKTFKDSSLGLIAVAENDSILMNVYSDQTGLQFYTGNFLGDGPDFKGNVPQIRFGGFCLETQTEPNCVKKNKGIYRTGDVYRHYTVYEFYKK